MKSLLYYLFFIHVAFGSFSFAKDLSQKEIQLKAISLKTDLNKKMTIEQLRKSLLYKKIYNICSSDFSFEKYSYFLNGIEYVTEMGFIDKDKSLPLITPQLSKTLFQASFYLALNDCNYSPEEKVLFILHLGFLDVSGQITTVFGMVKLYSLFSSLKNVKPWLYKTLNVLGIGAIFYELRDYLYDFGILDKANEDEQLNLKVFISTTQELDKLIDLESTRTKRNDNKTSLISLIDSELQELKKLLAKQKASGDDTQNTQEMINELLVLRATLIL